MVMILGTQLHATGQVQNAVVTRSMDGISWNEFVERIESSCPVHFYYIPDSIPDLTLSVSQDTILLTDFLRDLFSPFLIEVSTDNAGNIFLFRDHRIRSSLPEIYHTY